MYRLCKNDSEAQLGFEGRGVPYNTLFAWSYKNEGTKRAAGEGSRDGLPLYKGLTGAPIVSISGLTFTCSTYDFHDTGGCGWYEGLLINTEAAYI